MNDSHLHLAELRSIQNRCNFATIWARKVIPGLLLLISVPFERWFRVAIQIAEVFKPPCQATGWYRYTELSCLAQRTSSRWNGWLLGTVVWKFPQFVSRRGARHGVSVQTERKSTVHVLFISSELAHTRNNTYRYHDCCHGRESCE